MTTWNERSYEAYFVDVDGVLVHDSQPIPGAVEALAMLQNACRVLILTNNSTRSSVQHAARLASFGFRVQPSDIVCSSRVLAEMLLKTHGPVRIWPIGEAGLIDELVGCGHRIALDPKQAQWIATGMDRRFNYQKINQALQALRCGARWAATNQDGTYPVPDGVMPGAGAMVGALRGMGFEPDLAIGKPESPLYDAGKRLLSTEKILMIGDRLETDILGGIRSQIDTLLVLSGISRASDMASSGIHSTWIAPSLASLLHGAVTAV